MNTIVELNTVTKLYGEITALNNISLEIPRNQIFTLIGPNGSGKTTLLKILALLEKPTKGTVTFNGELVKAENTDKLRLNSTMVFQKTALFDTTVAKNVAYGLKLRGFSKKEIDEKIRNALKIVRLEGYEKRRAKKLSGGEQQRVSLARAISLGTKLLLLDEPTANLDQKNVSIIEAAIAQILREKDNTIVLATHNMLQMKTLSENVALLLNGELVNFGKTDKILEDNEKLAGFARIDNIFSGVSRLTGEGTAIIDVGDCLQIEAAIKKEGKISIFIKPEDIILSKSQFASSARNVLKGKIIEIYDLGSVVRLKVAAGKPFTVQITKRSFKDLRLNLNMEVYLAFKASSVQII
jgi:tungstate transport system ATP-binding protein